jgi:tRNA(Ile)-lysidine synthase
MGPDDEHVERFRRDVEVLTGSVPARLGVAVSGGPDSLALLLLAAAAYPGRIAVATVDHQLRPESAAEAVFVSDICRAASIHHAILPARVDTARSSLQRSAREARYAALGEWLAREAIDFLATAHHIEDQAETLLMRLTRSTGISGLAAIRSIGPVPGGGGTLVRPLLSWRREELRRVVDTAGLRPVSDPGNCDERFDRVRLRRLMADAPWLDPPALARSAGALAESNDALEWAADRLWDERVSAAGRRIILDPSGLPPELIRRLVLRILRELAPAASPRGQEIALLAEKLRAGRKATLAGIAADSAERWTFELAPPRRG